MPQLIPWCAGLFILLSAPPTAEPQPVFTRNPSFRVPLQLDAGTRAGLREIQLHVRRPPDGWRLQETVPADRRAFEYRAPRDGEYWFRFVLVDRDGRETPAQVRSVGPPGQILPFGPEAAALIVVVDTQPPEVDVHPVPVASGEVFLQCNIRDAHPDYATVRLEYQLADHTWRPLAPVAGSPGLFPVPDERILVGRVRATAADRAGNTVTREIDLGQTSAPSSSLAPRGRGPG